MGIDIFNMKISLKDLVTRQRLIRNERHQGKRTYLYDAGK